MKSKFQAEISKIEKAGSGVTITFEGKGRVSDMNPVSKEAASGKVCNHDWAWPMVGHSAGKSVCMRCYIER